MFLVENNFCSKRLLVKVKNKDKQCLATALEFIDPTLKNLKISDQERL